MQISSKKRRVQFIGILFNSLGISFLIVDDLSQAYRTAGIILLVLGMLILLFSNFIDRKRR